MSKTEASGLRLAELVCALAFATDLARGQPMEHELRTCLLAVHLGELLGLDEDDLSHVYYVALLRWIGCTGHAHELAAWFDDEIAAHARAATFDFGRPLDVLTDIIRFAGAGSTPIRRARTVVATLAAGRSGLEEFFRSGCEVAQTLAGRLGFNANISRALGQVFERWDGRGWPRGIGGEELAVSARIVQVAQDAVVFHRLGGTEAAEAVARERAGTIQDPEISERFRRNAPRLLKSLEVRSVREAVLAAEPGARPLLSETRFETALRAIADFVDLKSPCTAGHSSGVAELAATAATRCGLSDHDATSVRRAGFLHDLGRTGVPNGIWEKAGPLTEGEWERVRLHPYLTERILAHPAALARLGSLAALHHERLDGSGYHRGLSASMQPLPARILAAADAYHAMTEPRPYRAALPSESAAEELRREVRAGRLDGEAVEAILGSTGRRPRRREWPAGLSTREVEVLRLVSLGLSNRQMAGRLKISDRTVAHHVQHIYRKVGVSTRAAATLFAMQHNLLEAEK